MARRSETTTTTVIREKRVTFGMADLRKRLRLPADAELSLRLASVPGGDPQHWTIAADTDTLVATYERTSKPREGSA